MAGAWVKPFALESFASALEFAQRVARLPEAESNSLDIVIESNRVTITLALDAGTETAVALAAKLEAAAQEARA